MNTRKRVLGIAAIVVICAVLVSVPMEAVANGIPILENFSVLGGTVFVDALASQNGAGWDVAYTVTNPGTEIEYMSFGLGDPLTSELYPVSGVSWDNPPTLWFDPWWEGATSFFPYFSPVLLSRNEVYKFTVHFLGDEIFETGQSFTISGSAGRDIVYIPNYPKPNSDLLPVPEPATLLVLGIGIFAVGLWSRRKWEA